MTYPLCIFGLCAVSAYFGYHLGVARGRYAERLAWREWMRYVIDSTFTKEMNHARE